jgi:hypothetical protein
MQNVVNFYSEVVGLYSNAIELGLRAGKVIQGAGERAVREHLAFVEATTSQFAPVVKAEQPKDFVAAQSALVEGVRESFTNTAKNLFKIQQETGAEIKALVTEGAEKFSPEAVTKLFKAA